VKGNKDNALNVLSFSTKEIGSLGLEILQKKLEGQGVSKKALNLPSPSFHTPCFKYFLWIAWTPTFAWALPKRETIIGMSEAISLSGGTAVSIGAGLGAIEYLLSLTPLVTQFSATDNFSSYGTSDLKDRAYYDVTNLGATTAVSNTTANCLILIWPPYNDPMAHEALIIFQKKANPTSRVIYWGEEMGDVPQMMLSI
jgi:hypothetical protein